MLFRGFQEIMKRLKKGDLISIPHDNEIFVFFKYKNKRGIYSNWGWAYFLTSPSGRGLREECFCLTCRPKCQILK